MFKNLFINTSWTEEEKIQICLEEAEKICKKLHNTDLEKLNILEYRYTADAAVDELGLDPQLIHQLVEDYVVQILHAYPLFVQNIQKLQEAKAKSEALNFKSLRELAHKNLGVARNLRITDAEILLNELMRQEDPVYLSACLLALVACTVRLKPVCAFHTLKDLQI